MRGKTALVVYKPKPKKNTLAKVNRQIKTIKSTLKKERVYGQMVQYYNLTIGSDYTYVNLCDFASQGGVFGTSANDLTGNKAKICSIDLDMYLTASSEKDTIGYTIFLVSLKDNIGSDFNTYTGALGASINNHYVYYNGMAKLNTAVFKIHKTKRITMTNFGKAIGDPTSKQQFGIDCRWNWKIRPNKLVKNAYGDWRGLHSSVDPSNQYYLMIFNDNSALDAENPNIKINQLNNYEVMN